MRVMCKHLANDAKKLAFSAKMQLYYDFYHFHCTSFDTEFYVFSPMFCENSILVANMEFKIAFLEYFPLEYCLNSLRYFILILFMHKKAHKMFPFWDLLVPRI